MAPRLRGRRTWTSRTGLPTEAAALQHRDDTVVVVCGERLDSDLRAAVAAMVGGARVDPNRRGASELIIVEGLCAHPERVTAFWQKPQPAALIVVGCTLNAAAGAVREAVAGGIGPAYAAAMSLAPALAQGAPDARTRSVAATCLAGSRQARLLGRQPLARRVPWRLGQPLDRRAVFGAVRGRPSRAAGIDDDDCLGAERCGRYRSDCPVGAIRTVGATPRVDPRAGVSCGRCVTNCRTGPQAVASLPCIPIIGPGALLGLMTSATRIRVEACDDCHCRDVIEANTTFVDRLASVLGPPGSSRRSGAAEGGRSGQHLDPVVSPTAGPSGADGKAADQKNRTVSDRPVWREPEATNAGVTALLASFKEHGDIEHPYFDDGAATRVVRVDDPRCTLCGSCALSCPTSALALDAAAHVLAVDSSQCIGCGWRAVACPERAVTVERGVDISSILHGPTPLNVTRGSQVCGGSGTTIEVDPLVASVQRRLAALGKPPALIVSLRRCPECTGSGPDR